MYTNAMKKLLVIGYVWPEPNSTAAGSRMLQLLQCFADDGYLITFASPALASPHAVDLSQLNIAAVDIALNDSSFDLFIQQLQPTVVLFDRFMMEEQFAWRVEKHCPNALRLLDTEDLHCLRLARQKLAKQNAAQVILDVDEDALFSDEAVREVAAILRCDLSVMISRKEIALLIETFKVPAEQLIYIPYLLSFDKQKRLPDFTQRQHFMSIGNFRHEPNWDAVLQLKQSIWPLIRKRLPQAQLHVYGAYPAKKVTQLHNEKQGFLIKGWVEDAHEIMHNSKVLLAPLRFGAGLKGKFVDAAQCGLPSVTSTVGAEGFLMNNAALIVSDDFEAFAEHAVKLYEDERLWQPLQNNCADFLASHFDKQEHALNLIESINALLNNLAMHRRQNFTGRMLRHHSMKSTQYMSQWIEVKNKLADLTKE